MGDEAMNRVLRDLSEALTAVLEGPLGPAERCLALQALLWFQVRLVNFPSHLSPAC